MARYIATKGSDGENVWEQFSVFQIAEFLFADRGLTIDQTIGFIRALAEQEEAHWNEHELREVLSQADRGIKSTG